LCLCFLVLGAWYLVIGLEGGGPSGSGISIDICPNQTILYKYTHMQTTLPLIQGTWATPASTRPTINNHESRTQTPLTPARHQLVSLIRWVWIVNVVGWAPQLRRPSRPSATPGVRDQEGIVSLPGLLRQQVSLTRPTFSITWGALQRAPHLLRPSSYIRTFRCGWK